MKKTVLILSLALTTAQAQQTLIPVQTAVPVTISSASFSTPSVNLPDTPELRREITLTVPMNGMTLESALTVIARSAGLTILTQGVPSVQLRSGLNNIPAGEAINLLLNLYAPGIMATTQGKVLVVGNQEAVRRVQGVMTPSTGVTAQDLRVVSVPGLTTEQFAKIRTLLPGESVLFDTGRVILSGTSKDIEASQKVLATLPSTGQPVAAPQVTRVYGVSQDEASATAAAIKELTGATVTAVGGNLLVKGTAAQQQEAANLLSSVPQKPAQQVKATVKRSYDSLTPSADKAMLEALLAVKVTPLDQQRLIVVDGTEDEQKAVSTILGTQQLKVSQRNIGYYPVNVGKASDLLTPLRRELPGSDIQVVEGRNIISVQGTAQEQLRAASVLRQLQSGDTPADNGDELVTRSIKLGFTEADTLATSLSGLRLASAGTGAATTDGVSPVGGTSGQRGSVGVFADKRTNSLILTGPRAQVEEMSRAIASIDVPEKTVRMRLRVEQVSVTEVAKLGINWSFGLGGVNFGQNDGTLSVGYAPTLTPASISAALDTARTKGNTTTIIDSNFAGLSGQETAFQSGGELLFPSQTNVINGQTVTTPGQTYEYGLKIKVRPRIALDGTVVMAMETDLGSQPINGPKDSIQQNKQVLNSTVMIKKGETVVLGGVLTNTKGSSNKGVPGLMDVPVLGALFGTKSNNKEDQALLFIVSAEEVVPQPLPQTQGANGTQRVELPAQPLNTGASQP